MAEPNWQRLRKALLFGGIPFWRIERTIGELQDHLYELELEALRSGLSARDARREAANRLGDARQIERDLLARPELRGWWSGSNVMTSGMAAVGVLSGSVELQFEPSESFIHWSMAVGYASFFIAVYLYTLQMALLT